MTASMTARERARAELTREITDAARRQLATEGAASLSLRAIARELGLASSAIYRYFGSRDELLTALLIDAYNDVADAAETAAEQSHRAGTGHRDTWIAVWSAVRGWSLKNRHQFALLYGTPVPGYAAPAETTTAASRTPIVLADILTAAVTAGDLKRGIAFEVPPSAIEQDVLLSVHPELQMAQVGGLIAAWAQMIGTIGFELFGHFTGVVVDNDAFYRTVAGRCADQLGL